MIGPFRLVVVLLDANYIVSLPRSLSSLFLFVVPLDVNSSVCLTRSLSSLFLFKKFSFNFLTIFCVCTYVYP